MGLIAGAVVAAGAAAGSAYLKGRSQKNALNAQQNALLALEFLDVDEYKRKSRAQDREAFLERFKLFRRADPELAKVRSRTVQNVMDQFERRNLAYEPIRQLSEDAQAAARDERFKRLEGLLLDRAEENLALRGELPPEFQAELIRSGLESGAVTGFGTDRTGPLGQLLGNRIGSAQLALQAARENQSLGLTQGAQAIQHNRLNILRGIAPEIQNIDIANANLDLAAFNMANSNMPGQVGLSGDDLLSLLEANRSLRNQQTLALGDIKAARHIVSGNTAAGYLGAGTSGLQGILGGLGGGAGGGGLGGFSMGGGGGGGIGGLLGGGGTQSFAIPYISSGGGQSFLPYSQTSSLFGPTTYQVGSNPLDTFSNQALAQNYVRFLQQNNGINPYE